MPNPKSPKDVEDKTGVTEAININADPPATTGKDTENCIKRNTLSYMLLPKDINKERNFVLDIVTFLFHKSTASQTSWREYFKHIH